MYKKEIRNFPIKWDNNQKVILMDLFLLGKTFQEIADEINEYLKKIAKEYDTFPNRSERAVAFQCCNLNLISKEELEKWDKRRNQIRNKDRSKRLLQTKKRVFVRDKNMCIICGSKKSLEFAHVIPFLQTRLNLEIEAVTLCKEHHKKFDDGESKITKFIFDYMIRNYPNYQEQYSIIKTTCSVHGEHINIVRR